MGHIFWQRLPLPLTIIHTTIDLSELSLTDSNDSTSFSALHRNIDLFANDFPETFPDSDFLLDENQLPESKLTSETAAKQIKKLVY